MKIKSAVAAVLVIAGVMGAGVAQARPDVDWVLRIGLPLPPLPVVVLPAPVMRAPVVVEREPVYRDDRREWRGEREWRDEREWREHRHGHDRYYDRPARWDVDGDGVPNRYDRRPRDPRRY
jgi:hypothetical protein